MLPSLARSPTGRPRQHIVVQYKHHFENPLTRGGRCVSCTIWRQRFFESLERERELALRGGRTYTQLAS